MLEALSSLSFSSRRISSIQFLASVSTCTSTLFPTSCRHTYIKLDRLEKRSALFLAVANNTLFLGDNKVAVWRVQQLRNAVVTSKREKKRRENGEDETTHY